MTQRQKLFSTVVFATATLIISAGAASANDCDQPGPHSSHNHASSNQGSATPSADYKEPLRNARRVKRKAVKRKAVRRMAVRPTGHSGHYEREESGSSDPSRNTASSYYDSATQFADAEDSYEHPRRAKRKAVKRKAVKRKAVKRKAVKRKATKRKAARPANRGGDRQPGLYERSDPGFSEVGGLEIETPAIEYRHGVGSDYNKTKQPGIPKYSDINMKRPGPEDYEQMDPLAEYRIRNAQERYEQAQKEAYEARRNRSESSR